MLKNLSSDKPHHRKGIDSVGVTTCFICHDDKGSIFMAKRSRSARDEHGRWDVGGGSLDWGLTAEDNVKKEVQEEYGAKPVTIEFLGYRDVFRNLSTGEDTHWLALDFAVHVNPQDVRLNEPDKFDDSGWFRINTLPLPLHSQIHTMISTHKDRLRKILEL